MIKRRTFFCGLIVYLIFCLVYTIVEKDTSIVNSMVSSVAISSIFLSISDICSAKNDIDKKERKFLFGLERCYRYICISYKRRILKDYENIAKSVIIDEKEEDAGVNEELVLIQDIEDTEIKELEQNAIKAEKRRDMVTEVLGGLGILALIVIPCLRIEISSYISNILTEFGFLAVLIAYWVKENYKKKELKELEDKMKEARRELIEAVRMAKGKKSIDNGINEDAPEKVI